MGEEKLKPFDQYFLYPQSTINYLLSRGFAWVYATEKYRKKEPCLVATIYYLSKDIEYIKVLGLLVDENGRVIGAIFEDFEIWYDKRIGKWDYKLKISEEEIIRKYGRDFLKLYFGMLIGAINIETICRELVDAIGDYELGRGNITELGIRALYTIAAVKIEFFKFKEEVVERVYPLPYTPRKQIKREIKKEAVKAFVPKELVEIADKIRAIAEEHGVDPVDVLNMIKQLL